MTNTNQTETMTDEERGALRLCYAFSGMGEGYVTKARWDGLGDWSKDRWLAVYREHLAMATERATQAAPRADQSDEELALAIGNAGIAAWGEAPLAQFEDDEHRIGCMAILAKARELLCPAPTAADADALATELEPWFERFADQRDVAEAVAKHALSHVGGELAKVLAKLAQQTASANNLRADRDALLSCLARETGVNSKDQREAMFDKVRSQVSEIATLKAELAQTKQDCAVTVDTTAKVAQESVDGAQSELAVARENYAKAKREMEDARADLFKAYKFFDPPEPTKLCQR